MFSEWYRHLFLHHNIILEVFVRSFALFLIPRLFLLTQSLFSLFIFVCSLVRLFTFEFHEFGFNIDVHVGGSFSLVAMLIWS